MDIEIEMLKKPLGAAPETRARYRFSGKSTVIIGRDSQCDLPLVCTEKVISRYHARIDASQRGANTFHITDTSINGTFVNDSDEPIGQGSTRQLVDDDVIRVGEYWFRFTRLIHGDNNLQKQAVACDGGDVQRVQEKKPSSSPISPSRDTSSSLSQKSSVARKVIPEDWNVGITNGAVSRNPVDTSSALLLAGRDQKLVQSLLKGLGVSTDYGQVNPEVMLLVGRCLRSALTGMLKQREQTSAIKAKLCFGERELLDLINTDALSEFDSAQAIIEEVLKAPSRSANDMPLQIIRCQKELMEDQAAIVNSFNTAIDSFRDNLSPFAIEQRFQERPASVGKALMPSGGKWETYKQQWGEKCMSFKMIIRSHFADNIRVLSRRRSAAKRGIKKSVGSGKQ